MRLLLVTKDFPPDIGGIQTYVYELGKCFQTSCASFAVVAPSLPGAAEVDRSLPFEVVRIPGTRSSFAPSLLAALPWLKTRFGFNVVLGAQWQSAWGAVAGRRAFGPYVVCSAVHGREILTEHYAKSPYAFYDRARAYTLGRVDRLFPGSSYALRLVREGGYKYRSAEVITYGCSPERFAPPRDGAAKRRALGLDGKKVLLTLCRLVPRKGVDTVLEALPEIARSVPDVRYVVAGGGEDRARLLALAEKLGVMPLVQFLGRVPDADVPSLFDMADVFVMPAREERPCVEGFGLVFLEANACDKPVIASTSGGIPDAVVDGETGLLVPPAAPAPLAAAAIRLLGDAELRQRMGVTGRERVLRDATWERMAARLYASMSDLLRSEPDRKAELGLSHQ